MVRLRGMPRPGPPGRGMGRPMPRPLRPDHVLPPFGMPRGRLVRGHPVRPGPPRLPPPRMVPPGLPPPMPPRRFPLPPHPPLPPRDLPPPIGRRPLPPPPLPARPGLRMPPLPMPPMPPMHPLRRPPPPMRPGPPFVRGRGGVARRGVKRLGNTANGRAKKSQKRKEKTEGDFFCEACDCAFILQDLLDAHIAEHQVCGRDGCVFAAHPKVVEKHVRLQHDTGLYRNIVFSQNPEEIAKWIAARKSRYPTKENVEKKEAQNTEMIERGERIPLQGKRFSHKDKWQDRKRNRNTNQNIRNVDGSHQKKKNKPIPVSNDENKWKDPDVWRGDLPKFPGTAAFPLVNKTENVDEEKQFSDEEPELITKQKETTVSKPLFSTVLASLMMDYASDTDDESRENNSIATMAPSNQEDILGSLSNGKASSNADNDVLSKEPQISRPDDDDSGPEEASVQREDATNEPVPKPKDSPQENRIAKIEKSDATKSIRPKPPVRHPIKRIQLSLLEKLLQNEIRHERNAILQCVCYVVKNNFFGCGSNK